jgi:hypothetical protein
MAPTLTIPVFTGIDDARNIGGPASIADKIKTEVQDVVASLVVDEHTLGLCIQAAQNLMKFVEEKFSNTKIKTDTISFQLGITATGKVGFLGTGVDVQFAATLQLTLKVQ